MGRPDMAYYSFTKNIMEGRPIKVFNHGKLSRDFTYITDIVDGVVSCLGITYEHEILNLGRGEPQQLMGFIHSIERATGKDAVLEYVDMAKGDVLTTYADVTKARRLLGYNPKISLDEGIDKFVDWFRMIRKKSTS
jgi:UDP-glucuronate 4-epimerase